MLNITYDLSSSPIRIGLAGAITEKSETKLAELAGKIAGKAAAIDCAKIGEINSLGAKIWITTMSELTKSSDITFEKCSPVFMNYRILIPSMTGQGKISSILVAYSCDHCGASTEALVEEQDFSTEEELQPVPCPECSQMAEPDIQADELFSFLLD